MKPGGLLIYLLMCPIMVWAGLFALTAAILLIYSGDYAALVGQIAIAVACGQKSTIGGTVGAPTRPSVTERLVDQVSPMPSIESFAFDQAEPPDDQRHQRWQQAREWQHEQWRRQEEQRQRISYQHRYPPMPHMHPMPTMAPMHPTSHAAMAPRHPAQPSNKNISFDEAFFD